MRKTTMTVAALVVTNLMLLAGTASADPRKAAKDDEGYSYTFKDDDLLGAGITDMSARITVVPTGRRDRLIRPRIQFVTEMLKSVENL